jgi:Tfp pilus assembly protein PilW
VKGNGNSKNGFMLMELLVAMAATLLLLSALTGVLAASLKAWRADSRKVEVQQTARSASDALVRDMRYAESITIDSDGHGITVKQRNAPGMAESIHLYCNNAGVLYRRNITAGGRPQPVTGGNSVKVSAGFTQNNKRTFTVAIEAEDAFTDTLPRQRMTLSAKIINMNIP